MAKYASPLLILHLAGVPHNTAYTARLVTRYLGIYLPERVLQIL
jgi:hypothetical protein